MAASPVSKLKEFSVVEKEANDCMTNGDVEKAKQLYTRFIEGQKNSTNDKKTLALATNNRGHLRYLTVDFHGAIEDYTAAIELDPCLPVSYYNRGQIHYRMGRFQLAIDDLEKALELDQNFVDARDNLSQAKKDFATNNTNPS
jgi:tetratricopeptide (TPR) repeat protein